ncbi:MAG TPA: hypothetical protein VGC89_08020 [Pyrinomonadaceae bacterium]|jgi:hypothetical protein
MMHVKAALLLWSLFSLWQRDSVDTSSGSYQVGRIVGRVFLVVLLAAIVFAVLKKRAKK